MESKQPALATSASLPVPEALKEAFIVSWKFKWFWPLGFILNPQLLGVNYYGSDLSIQSTPTFGEILFWLLIIAAILFFLSLAAALVQPTLILAVDAYRQGKSPRCWNTLRAGLDHFLRVWLLGLLWFMGGMAALFIVAIPVVLAFTVEALLGVLALMFALLIMMLLALFVIPVASFSYRHIVLNNMGIIDSITAGYATFRSMMGRSVGMTIATIVIVLAIYIAVSIPVGIFQFMFEFSSASESMLIYAIYLLVAFALSVVFQGYLQAFSSAAWTLVFPSHGKVDWLEEYEVTGSQLDDHSEAGSSEDPTSE